MQKIIRQVLYHKGADYFWITIPKKHGIKKGDYVEIKKIK